MKIAELIIGENYMITVCFDSGHSVTLDMKKKLQTVRFSDLRNEAVFGAAKTDGKAIYWPGGISVSVSEVIEILTK